LPGEPAAHHLLNSAVLFDLSQVQDNILPFLPTFPCWR
jgi:hypothetical protein